MAWAQYVQDLVFFWLEILLKIKPNEENENIKFWLQTTTGYRLLLKSFLKNPYPHKDFDFFLGATLQLVENIKPIR